MFSDRDLKNIIVPLFLEQLLVMLVGIADTFVVTFVSEEAAAGVSLVNAFNNIFVFLFVALASGGAVVISQYIGRGDNAAAGNAASQLLMISTLFSLIVGTLIFLANQWLMGVMFGRLEPAVMDACITYLRISAYSYPFLAVYNAGAALYRSFGNTRATMYLSIAANFINVAGNLIGVFALQAGVAGVAYPSLLSRAFSVIVITALCFFRKNSVYYGRRQTFAWDRPLLRRILSIAIPNGVESGIFQLVKVGLSSVAALFGTYQIAANGIAQTIWSTAALVCVSMGPVFITVVGQTMGAGDISGAEREIKRLMKLTLRFSVLWNGLIAALTPVLMMFYAVEPETKTLVVTLVVIHNVFNTVAFPFADPLGKGLRAAGDVRFTTAVSLCTTIGLRLTLSLLFGVVCSWGVLGLAAAMCLDWTVRGVIFYLRFRSMRWTRFQVI